MRRKPNILAVLGLAISLVACAGCPQLPDLEVLGVNAATVDCSEGEEACVTTVMLDIRNIGMADAPSFDVQVVFDPDPDFAVTQTIAGLAQGETVVVTVISPAGGNCFDPDCTICVTVDSGNEVGEINELNNERCVTVGDDRDEDGVADDIDVCPDVPNPLQMDIDGDGVGDLCDNCPVRVNPMQEDSNKDGGGDACEPPVEFAHCGEPFTPELGIDDVLFDPGLPHPLLKGVVHPVIQFSTALMEDQARLLEELDIQFHAAIAFNVFLISIPQGSLDALASAPFVRSVFPLPSDCRQGPEAHCPGLLHGRWQQLDPRTNPTQRSKLAMSFDSRRRVSVMFGGEINGSVGNLRGTWEWDGEDWNQSAVDPGAGPSPRANHAMAFDEARGVSVLFGGLIDDSGTSLGSDETWLWDGTNWKLASPTDRPTPRHGHAMAYDSERNVVVLFGGMDDKGNLLNDTWTWNGSAWTDLRVGGPRIRSEHAMAYDADRHEVVLFGGNDGIDALDDTWVWNGTAWEMRNPATLPPARSSHAMSDDDRACGALLFGGQDDSGRGLSDTWFWNGQDWTAVTATDKPTGRFDHGLVYDSSRRRSVLFGGAAALVPVTELGDTWEFEASRIVDVSFFADVSPSAAEGILSDRDALVLQSGALIGGTAIVNTWQVAIPVSEITPLADLDPVARVDEVIGNQIDNDGVSICSGADDAQMAPFGTGGMGANGGGIVMAIWDGGWAAGDLAGPMPLPLGAGAHAALTGRITVRDGVAMNPPGCAPFGAGAAVTCVNAANPANSVCLYHGHPTHVAGTMLGDGTTTAPMIGVMIGMAPAATAISYGWPTSATELRCEFWDANNNFNARLANNSFSACMTPGCANQGMYDCLSQSYDTHINAFPGLAVLFSAGNSQRVRVAPWRACSGVMQPACMGLPAIYNAPSVGGACAALPPGVALPAGGFAAEPAAGVRNRFFTLTPGRGQCAKNALVIGAINAGAPSVAASHGRMTSFSAWGPTQDGRIKPDLVAAGAEDNARVGVRRCGTMGALPAPACDPDPQVMSTDCAGGCGAVCNTVNNAYGGCRGTSMSTPAVTGAAALALEQHIVSRESVGDAPLDSDSLKALLIHTAVDLSAHVGNAFMALQDCDGDGANDDCWPIPAVAAGVIQDGPDYVNGWGLVDIEAALNKIITGNPAIRLWPTGCSSEAAIASLPFNSPLDVGGNPAGLGLAGCPSAIWDWVGYVEVPMGTTQLKITIAWDDLPIAPPAAGAVVPTLLVNDLDLIVSRATGPGGSTFAPYHYSWWLDPGCSYRQAVRIESNDFDGTIYSDHRNNVEQVIVDNPDTGWWRIVVQASGIAGGLPGLTGTQPFGIVISMPPSVP